MIPSSSVNSANSPGVHLNENWLAGPASRPMTANILPPILKTRSFCHKTSSVTWRSERQYSRIFSRVIIQSLHFVGLRVPPCPGDHDELQRQSDPVKDHRVFIQFMMDGHVYVGRVDGQEQHDQSPRGPLLKTRN